VDLQAPKPARFITPEREKAGLELLARINREHRGENPGDPRPEPRIASYELAAKIQLSAPSVLDLPLATEGVREMSGLNDSGTDRVGRNCLVAWRLIERGTRCVQVWSGAGGPTGNWDNHANIKTELPAIARTVDKPIAGLLRDLKARGLLADTLLIW